MTYDVNGYLERAFDAKGARSLRYFNSATGQVLRRDESKGAKAYTHRWHYAAGRRIGDVTTDPDDRFRLSYAEQLARDTDTAADRFKLYRPVTSADFDQSYEPINADHPAATGTTYTVRSGDTLQSIARTELPAVFRLPRVDGQHRDPKVAK